MIDRAVAEIDAEGAGVIVLLRDLVPDVLSRRLSGQPLEIEDDDIRRVIGLGSQILRELGVGRMIVLSGAPQRLVGLEGYGLSVDGWREFKS
jgi:3,4-dihydroxy 2-butanone 4-phosphate synthase/GTP cyclohydrolase II